MKLFWMGSTLLFTLGACSQTPALRAEKLNRRADESACIYLYSNYDAIRSLQIAEAFGEKTKVHKVSGLNVRQIEATPVLSRATEEYCREQNHLYSRWKEAHPQQTQAEKDAIARDETTRQIKYFYKNEPAFMQACTSLYHKIYETCAYEKPCEKEHETEIFEMFKNHSPFAWLVPYPKDY